MSDFNEKTEAAELTEKTEKSQRNGYKINLGGWNGVFAVPTAVVDNYIKYARESSLKVLLYFLRHAGESLDDEAIAQSLGIRAEQVRDGLSFWEQVGLISESENAPNSGEFAPSDKEQILQNRNDMNNVQPSASVSTPAVISAPASPVAAANAPAYDPMLSVKKVELTREPIFSPKAIAQSVRGSEEMNYLFKSAEILFKRTLKPHERNTLMVLTEEDCLPVDVTLMLVGYCCEANKASPAFMKQLALDWIERDIKNVALAEEEIVRLRKSNDTERELRRRFELTSGFSKQQKQFISDWTNSLGFSVEMIEEAYQATLNGAGKLSYQYMDKVLRGWKDKGITSPAALKESNTKRKEQKAEENKPSFDIDEYMVNAMKKYKQN